MDRQGRIASGNIRSAQQYIGRVIDFSVRPGIGGSIRILKHENTFVFLEFIFSEIYKSDVTLELMYSKFQHREVGSENSCCCLIIDWQSSY